MPVQGRLDEDVALYAGVAATLATGPRPRAEVLREHGLDEDAWAELDARWQDRLSEALESAEDGLPPLVAAHAEAFARAQRADAGQAMPLARFAEATAVVRRGGDVAAGLARLGLDLATYLAASRELTERAATDPAVAAAFAAAVSRR